MFGTNEEEGVEGPRLKLRTNIRTHVCKKNQLDFFNRILELAIWKLGCNKWQVLGFVLEKNSVPIEMDEF
jgi:hypothetical protein